MCKTVSFLVERSTSSHDDDMDGGRGKNEDRDNKDDRKGRCDN